MKYAIRLNSGYDALNLSLRAAGIRPGDEVIVRAHTFVATCSAVHNVGATPVLVDVADDFGIDVMKVEPAITSRTRGIIPVHLSGWMADMPAVMALAEQHELAVIEDACQSLGSSIGGRRAGSWGLTGCWSFYPFKILGGYGDGGAITTDDEEEVATFVRRMRYNGEDRQTGRQPPSRIPRRQTALLTVVDRPPLGDRRAVQAGAGRHSGSDAATLRSLRIRNSNTSTRITRCAPRKRTTSRNI